MKDIIMEKIKAHSMLVECILVVVILSTLILMAAFAKICDECGATFFGKGYYSSDALWKSNGEEITLCASCASKDWAPFDYRSHAK